MKVKLEYSEYDPIHQVSYAAIRRGDQLFTGMVELHPNDADIASKYAGCRFAEIKAKIKMYKYLYQEKKKELKVLENSYDQLEYLKDFWEYENTSICRHLRKKIHIKRAEVQELKELIQMIEEAYPKIIEQRERAVRKEIPGIQSHREFINKLAKQDLAEPLLPF